VSAQLRLQASRRGVLGGCVLLPALCPAIAVAADCSPIFDAHIHFFTNDIARYPIDPRGAREPEEVMRARVLRDPVLPDATLRLWDRLGVSAGVGVQYRGAYKYDNSYVLDVADANPQRVLTEILLSDEDEQAPKRLRELARARRVTAVRLTGFEDEEGLYPWMTSPGAHHIWQAAQELGLPVCLTCLPQRPMPGLLRTVGALAERYSNCVIVLEHLGWTGGRDTGDGLLAEHFALRHLPNLYFKWTTLNIDDLGKAGIPVPDFLEAAVRTFGPGKLMWGSDFGNSTRPYEGLVAEARNACRSLTSTERLMVLGDTGRAVFISGVQV